MRLLIIGILIGYLYFSQKENKQQIDNTYKYLRKNVKVLNENAEIYDENFKEIDKRLKKGRL